MHYDEARAWVDKRQGAWLERGHGSLVAESFEAWLREDGPYTEASLINSALQFVRIFCDFRFQVIISKRGHWRKIAPESTAESSHPAVCSPASPALRGRGSDGAILAPNIPGLPVPNLPEPALAATSSLLSLFVRSGEAANHRA